MKGAVNWLRTQPLKGHNPLKLIRNVKSQAPSKVSKVFRLVHG